MSAFPEIAEFYKLLSFLTDPADSAFAVLRAFSLEC